MIETYKIKVEQSIYENVNGSSIYISDINAKKGDYVLFGCDLSNFMAKAAQTYEYIGLQEGFKVYTLQKLNYMK